MWNKKGVLLQQRRTFRRIRKGKLNGFFIVKVSAVCEDRWLFVFNRVGGACGWGSGRTSVSVVLMTRKPAWAHLGWWTTLMSFDAGVAAVLTQHSVKKQNGEKIWSHIALWTKQKTEKRKQNLNNWQKNFEKCPFGGFLLFQIFFIHGENKNFVNERKLIW